MLHWIVKNDCSNCTTKQDTTKVYQIPDGLFPGQQVMLRGRVPWGSKSWVTCIKEIQRRMCMLVCVGGRGRRKWYMTSSKLFHVSYFFHPMHGSLFNLMSLPHLQKKRKLNISCCDNRKTICIICGIFIITIVTTRHAWLIWKYR